ncbi:MAG: phosphate acyltransferase PlsX [Hyphomicrobiaceae bacterium]|nr:phosphate acyltransferase PlsX [Hyphomicrobiaceae bacterium]
MTTRVPRILALDCMGGDHGPSVIVPGAAIALERHPNLRFELHGNKTAIEAELDRVPHLAKAATIHHTDTVIGMDAKPSQALRRGKGSSMWNAIEAVKAGRADFAVSAGNTGALMVLSMMILRAIPGIDRPALAGQWPTIHRSSIVLDVGANIGATARELADFALMGAAMARAIYGIERPTVGLLNVGSEEIKGVEEVKQAHAWLKQVDLDLDYKGFVEGDQIGQGLVDVVVVEGFAGNIALKTAEGTAKQIATYLKEAMTSSLKTKLGALLAKSGFNVLKHRMDPRRVNGGTFLGLNGIVIKSHGGTDAIGFASAIEVGHGMAARDIVGQLKGDLLAFHSKLDAIEASLSKRDQTKSGTDAKSETNEKSGAAI